MEWKLKMKETDSGMKYVMGNDLYMLIELVNIPCYKGKIVLPDGEVIDIVLCVEENGGVPILCLPYKVFDKILIDVKKEEVILSADIDKLKFIIENNNKRYLEEIYHGR